MLAMLIGLQYRLWIGSGSFAEVWLLEKKIEQQIVKNKLLEDRNHYLNEEVLDLKRGYDAIEERARFDFGMIKKGETFVMVVSSHK